MARVETSRGLSRRCPGEGVNFTHLGVKPTAANPQPCFAFVIRNHLEERPLSSLLRSEPSEPHELSILTPEQAQMLDPYVSVEESFLSSRLGTCRHYGLPFGTPIMQLLISECSSYGLETQCKMSPLGFLVLSFCHQCVGFPKTKTRCLSTCSP